MDRLSKLVTGAGLFFLASISYAGYAQLSPPSYWSPTPVGGSVGSFNVGAAANAATISNGTVRTNAALNVGGRAIQVPVSMRLAANAPKIAAAAIFVNPLIASGLSIASWLAAGVITYNALKGGWEVATPSVDEFVPNYLYTIGDGKYHNNIEDAVTAYRQRQYDPSRYSYFKVLNVRQPSESEFAAGAIIFQYEAKFASFPYDVVAFDFPIHIKRQVCPSGWQATPAGCLSPQVKTRQIVDGDDFYSVIRKNPMPDKVPQEMPVHLPVEVPQINPQPDSSPFFVPTGDPVPNPNFDPSRAPSPQNVPKIQPGTRVSPANDPAEPWRVDVTPVDKPILDPNAAPDRNPDFGGNPNGETPSKNPQQADLCEKNPDILACATQGGVDDEPIKEKNLDIKISPESGWGASSAACPAPKVISPQGRQILIPYDLFCTYSQGMRPIILAMAWLSAAFILLGARETS